MNTIYKVENLEEARNFLSSANDNYILTNTTGSVKYYGMLVIDSMFKTLRKEFPNKIEDIVVNVDDDHAALFTSIKLGYKNIEYKGDSDEARKLYGQTVIVRRDCCVDC